MMNKTIEQLAAKLLVPTPSHLRKHHIDASGADLKAIEASLSMNYHVGWRDRVNYTPQAYEDDLRHHTNRRLEIDRRFIVPWLDSAKPLNGQQILEIGCGTGSSTIALTEQGAVVTGIDIDEGALQVARDRCQVYGVSAEFHTMNAGQLATLTPKFDHIIFFASLEHMTLGERLAALSDAWSLLPKSGLLTVVETPNRLWYFDDHTSRMPFFHWLPDELAFDQSRRSPRENFRELYREHTPESFEHFLRRGRGVSFHEFDSAIRPIEEIKVRSSLSSFWGFRYHYRQSRLGRKYKALLKKMHSGVDQGFLDKDLYIVLEKT